MKVCVEVRPSWLSRSIYRVANALTKHAPPWVTIVPSVREADLVVHHIIGLTGVKEMIERDQLDDRKYAIIQYCLKTTENPTPEAWLPIWRGASVVWSYYDLESFAGAPLGVPFVYQSLGVDTEAFQMNGGKTKYFLMGTSGYVAETEGVREAYAACVKNGGTLFHLGPNLNLGSAVLYALDIGDGHLARYWSMCKYVAGLRRVEGFELPVLEALAVGTRPVCFDAPHYRQWFREHAEYIPEGSPEEVTDHLTELIRRPVRVVTPAERAYIAERFSWKHVCEPFWNALEGVAV